MHAVGNGVVSVYSALLGTSKVAVMEDKIDELVLDPRWRMGTLVIDGNRLAFLTIEHPRHGPLYFQLPRASLNMLRNSITRMLDQVQPDAARKGAGPAQPDVH